MGELTMQLAIVFVGRQTINNFQEMILPALKRWWRKRSAGEEFERENNEMAPWERDVRAGVRKALGGHSRFFAAVLFGRLPQQRHVQRVPGADVAIRLHYHVQYSSAQFCSC